MMTRAAFCARLFPLLVVALAAALSAGETALGDALLFHASFDNGLDADFALGDKTLYATSEKNPKRAEAKPGLPEGELVKHAKEEGRFGAALYFTRKMKPVVFFKGDKNLNYSKENWSGSCSVWLRLDPDKDLEPGYCDPLQFVAQAWAEGNMFLEFSKDHTPRHFRYAIQCVRNLWNPQNLKWEEVPNRPMVNVDKVIFNRDKWTHVLFTFANINTGKKDGVGKLYINGKFAGEFADREQTFNWIVADSAVTLGLNYVGYLDELALFNRALAPDEVKQVYALQNGVRDLKK